MRRYEKVVGLVLSGVFFPLLLSNILGHTPKESTISVASSFFLSETPVGSVSAVTSYSYGFTCHAKATELVKESLEKGDFYVVNEILANKYNCSALAGKIAGL